MVRNFLGPVTLALAVLFVASIPSFAKNDRRIHIPVDVVLNGKTIPAGYYQIRWETHSPDATITFSTKRIVLVTTKGRVLDGKDKYNSDEVVYNTESNGSNTLVEIRFAGSRRVIRFDSASPASQVIPGAGSPTALYQASHASRSEHGRIKFLGKPVAEHAAPSPFDAGQSLPSLTPLLEPQSQPTVPDYLDHSSSAAPHRK